MAFGSGTTCSSRNFEPLLDGHYKEKLKDRALEICLECSKLFLSSS